MDPYETYDGLALADLVRRKAVSPVELVDSAIARIERFNPMLNAVVTQAFEQARSAALQPISEAPFAGVPFLLKDLMAASAGIRLSNGSRYFRDYAPDHDSELVARFKAAGFIVLGKTNTPEFGLVPVTEPLMHGPTFNPWDVSRTPGGSSGGSAAAVAARMVPIAHASDGGGSVRIPASCCGLFGLKPTRGRNPLGPDIGEGWHGAIVEHVLTRSVRDSAAVLDATNGPDRGAPYFAAPPDRPYLNEVGTPPGKLRIAYSAKPPIAAQVHPDCVAAMEAAARLCESLGHHVEQATPILDQHGFVNAFLLVLAAETAAELDFAKATVGRVPAADDFEVPTRLLALLGRQYHAGELAAAVRTLQLASRQVAEFFETYDMLLTPTLAAPPVRIGELQPRGVEAMAQSLIASLRAGWLVKFLGGIEKLAERVFDFIPFTPLFNVTGQPAMSVPLHWNAAGLPIGVHFVGRYGAEASLFRLAAQLETAQPWADRRPTILN